MAASLVVSGGAKFLGGHLEEHFLGQHAYYTLGWLELSAAVLLTTRAATWAAVGVVGLSAAGLAYAWLGGESACGCLGTTRLTTHQHVLWASGTGAAAGAWLAFTVHARRTAGR
ncbi:MAG: hypothetical protein CMJ84_14980 [Planctomycetes bacterium]|jgi:hypothetical protein|nr:hypothetical protein [Planctomycetota bacterium]